MTFGIVPESEWQLDRRLGEARRKRLLETSFDCIVQGIARQADLYDFRSRKIKKFPGSERAEIELILPCRSVDLFHSGAGGYRAQYYLGGRLGDRANRFAIDRLLGRLKDLFEPQSQAAHWDFVEASLCHSDAKLWIYEGAWLSDNDAKDRNLVVARWKQNAAKIPLSRRFDPSAPELTPAREMRLELKGGCVDENFRHVTGQLKPGRSQELYEFGYT